MNVDPFYKCAKFTSTAAYWKIMTHFLNTICPSWAHPAQLRLGDQYSQNVRAAPHQCDRYAVACAPKSHEASLVPQHDEGKPHANEDRKRRSGQLKNLCWKQCWGKNNQALSLAWMRPLSAAVPRCAVFCCHNRLADAPGRLAWECGGHDAWQMQPTPSEDVG